MQPGILLSLIVAIVAGVVSTAAGSYIYFEFFAGPESTTTTVTNVSPSKVLIGSRFDIIGENLDQISEVLFVKGAKQIRLTPLYWGSSQLTVPLSVEDVDPGEYSILLKTKEGVVVATGLTIKAESEITIVIPSPTLGSTSPPISTQGPTPSLAPSPTRPPEWRVLLWTEVDGRKIIDPHGKYWEKYERDSTFAGLYLGMDNIDSFGDFLNLKPNGTFKLDVGGDVTLGGWQVEGSELLLKIGE